MPMSSSTMSGRNSAATRSASTPSCATHVSCPSERSSMSSIAAASTLSSTTSTRRAITPRLRFRLLLGTHGNRVDRAGERHAQGELAAAVHPLAARLDAAAVQLGDASRKRETDAEPAADALQRRAALHEHVEDALDHFRLDAASAVAHAHHGFAP